jgi:sRNA-binding carbon storage regulator CsrA
MLVIRRRLGESLLIGGDVEIEILDLGSGVGPEIETAS